MEKQWNISEIAKKMIQLRAKSEDVFMGVIAYFLDIFSTHHLEKYIHWKKSNEFVFNLASIKYDFFVVNIQQHFRKRQMNKEEWEKALKQRENTEHALFSFYIQNITDPQFEHSLVDIAKNFPLEAMELILIEIEEYLKKNSYISDNESLFFSDPLFFFKNAFAHNISLVKEHQEKRKKEELERDVDKGSSIFFEKYSDVFKALA